MLATKYRIPREKISFILKKGNFFETNLFLVRYWPNEKDFSRYRVIVSKKIYPKAVKRNLLRRQIYEIIRQNMTTQHLPKNIILIPKKKILNYNYQQMQKDIQKHITQS